MLFKRFISLASLACLASMAYHQWRAHKLTHERLKQVKCKPGEVTTWEGEGGALRGTGAQMGPDPETAGRS